MLSLTGLRPLPSYTHLNSRQTAVPVGPCKLNLSISLHIGRRLRSCQSRGPLGVRASANGSLVHDGSSSRRQQNIWRHKNPADPSRRRGGTKRQWSRETLDDWVVSVGQGVDDGLLSHSRFIVESIRRVIDLERTENADSVVPAVDTICLLLEHSDGVQQISKQLIALRNAAKLQPALGRALQRSPEFRRQYARALAAASASGRHVTDASTASRLALAQLYFRVTCPAFWLRVQQELLPRWSPVAPRELRGLLTAAAKLQRSAGLKVPAELASVFLLAVEEAAPRMSCLEVSDTLWSFAKLGIPVAEFAVRRCGVPDPLLQRLSEQAQYMDAFQVAQSLYALAVLGVTADCVPAALLEAVPRVARGMEAQGVANVLWAWSTFGVAADSSDSVLEPLLEELPRVAGDMNAQEVSNALWACAELQMTANSSMPKAASCSVPEALLRAIPRVAHRMNPQDVPNTLLACAKLGMDDDSLLQPLLEAAERVGSEMNAQGVSNTLHALAKLDMAADSVPASVRHAVPRVVDDMTPQGVANALYAWAKLGLHVDSLPESLPRVVGSVARNMKAQEVMHTLWAWAKLKAGADSVPETLLRAVPRVAFDLNAKGVATTLWALAELGLPASDVPQSLIDAVGRVAGDMSKAGAKTTRWAWEQLCLDAHSLPESLHWENQSASFPIHDRHRLNDSVEWSP